MEYGLVHPNFVILNHLKSNDCQRPLVALPYIQTHVLCHAVYRTSIKYLHHPVSCQNSNIWNYLTGTSYKTDLVIAIALIGINGLYFIYCINYAVYCWWAWPQNGLCLVSVFVKLLNCFFPYRYTESTTHKAFGR